jgi:putative ABC transport system ATP-binding protein
VTIHVEPGLGPGGGVESTPPVVSLEAVGRTFPGPPEVHALHSADLVIERGDYLGLVGPSGSGKSTLLHLLGLLDSPTSGIYRLNGIDTGALSEPERAGLRASEIGFVFQAFHLLAQRSNVENVMLADVYRPGGRRERRQRAVAALESVGLGHRLDGHPTTLSGGERQRVAVARALVSEPSIVLADEPTGNLDSRTSATIMELFDDLHHQGLTIVVITHDDDVAARAGRLVRIQDGRLSAQSAGAA